MGGAMGDGVGPEQYSKGIQGARAGAVRFGEWWRVGGAAVHMAWHVCCGWGEGVRYLELHTLTRSSPQPSRSPSPSPASTLSMFLSSPLLT